MTVDNNKMNPETDNRFPEEISDDLQRLRTEFESESEDLVLEPVPFSKEELRALSEEELQEQIDVLKEQLELENRRKQLDRRAINLGLLRIANESPRCSHLKSNGEPCRAPAVRDKLFCIFHSRALETQDEPRIKVRVLEDQESLQLTVKQVMEQVVSGRLEPQTASLLLRAVQIANATLKPKGVRAARIEPKSAEVEEGGWGNAEQSSA